MWYVIQVRTGSEESISKQCRRLISSEIMEQCFIPRYEERKKIRGSWITEKKILFPGYVFIVTESVESFYKCLQQVIGLTKLLGSGDDIVPLTDREVAFLKRMGGEKQVVEMSEGIIEGGKVRIISGPLQGQEALIRKIDRHKKKAWIEVEMFRRVQLVCVGLEIVAKI